MGSLALVWQLVYDKENWIQTSGSLLKNLNLGRIPLVVVEGLGKYILCHQDKQEKHS